MTAGASRPCWQNCSGAEDDEVRLIDAMEDALGPWDERTTQIRRRITLFEACDHEGDKEAEFIAGAIGAEEIDPGILATLRTPTPVKRRLAASLDKTIRLHLTQPFHVDLF